MRAADLIYKTFEAFDTRRHGMIDLRYAAPFSKLLGVASGGQH